MQLYRKSMMNGMRDRPNRTLSIKLDERPDRPIPMPRTNRERVKLIKKIESVIRSSMEYKDYIRFLKEHMDMNRCTVLKGLQSTHGSRYTIEVHHEPFTLFDLVDTIINKYDAEGEPLSVYKIADEVMELHYSDMVGLIPVSKTMHELIHADKIFVPLQFVYHKYDKFFMEYESFISPMTKEKIEAKVQCSMKCEEIMSDVLDPEFVYVQIDGFDFPQVPDSWKTAMAMDGGEALSD